MLGRVTKNNTNKVKIKLKIAFSKSVKCWIFTFENNPVLQESYGFTNKIREKMNSISEILSRKKALLKQDRHI